MMGILLISIGLGVVGVCVFVYQMVIATYFKRLRLLRLIGVAAAVLIVLGVAQQFGVHSALVVASVTVVGNMLRRMITLPRLSLRSVPSPTSGLESREPLRPD